jgi:Icc-related predicted phosphoesterase
MKIALVSDLHIEFRQAVPALNPAADLIVLAGDCHSRLDSLELAAHYRREHGVPVIVLAGNHEFYGADIDQLLLELRARAAALDGVHFLENERLELGGVRFLGCTLWSDCALSGPDRTAFHRDKAAAIVPDFRLIQLGGERFTPADAAARSDTSYRWLAAELAAPFAGKTVVITHFSPHRAAIHPHFLKPGSDELTPYFTRDCAELMQRHAPAAWLFGHTHGSVDLMVEGGTRLVSNQRGYPDEPPTYTRFDPLKLIEL